MIARIDFELTPELIYLIEVIKVEGYWSDKTYTLTIQNKNLPFLRYVEKIVKKLEMHISRRILIKIKPKESVSKSVISLKYGDKHLSFHIEKSPFDGTQKIVTSQPYKRNYEFDLKIKNTKHVVLINVGKEKIEVESDLKGWAYYDIRFPSIRFLRFLSAHLGNKKELRVEPFLFNAKKEYVASALSALIDAEGSVNYYGLFRKIRIRMRSKKYLKDWKILLCKFGIAARFQKNSEKEYEICIEGWQDFNKLNEMGLNLHHSEKIKKWKNIMDSYKRNQVSRNTAHSHYIEKLKQENKPITARELAIKLRKSKRVINHYLNLLDKKKLIKVDKSNMVYRFSSK